MQSREAFISYVEEDGEFARELGRELRALGHTTWTYDEDSIAGVSYLAQVHRAIGECRVFVLIASQQSVLSHQVVREVEQAHEQKKVIIPVLMGITHQQFASSGSILRMASGTAVSLPAGAGQAKPLALHIQKTIRFAAGLEGVDQSDGKPSSKFNWVAGLGWSALLVGLALQILGGLGVVVLSGYAYADLGLDVAVILFANALLNLACAGAVLGALRTRLLQWITAKNLLLALAAFSSGLPTGFAAMFPDRATVQAVPYLLMFLVACGLVWLGLWLVLSARRPTAGSLPAV
jgi:hypothetical protein